MTKDFELIKKLREKTGAGYSDCQNALKDSGGDVEKAVEILRKKGISVALKKSSRAAKEGAVASYIHMGGKIGVLVEINCETDFVAKTDDFKHLAKEVAMQIAAANPKYIKIEDVPQAVIEKEKEILKEGIAKFYEEVCLLEQPSIRDANLKVKDMVTNAILKIGENILIRRFVRFQVGEEV